MRFLVAFQAHLIQADESFLSYSLKAQSSHLLRVVTLCLKTLKLKSFEKRYVHKTCSKFNSLHFRCIFAITKIPSFRDMLNLVATPTQNKPLHSRHCVAWQSHAYAAQYWHVIKSPFACVAQTRTFWLKSGHTLPIDCKLIDILENTFPFSYKNIYLA